MTILGRGDLAPPRRGRRRRSPLAAIGALLALAGLAAGGWFGWRAWSGHDAGPAAPAVVVCTTPTPSASPAAAKGVTIAVLNTTKRDGLAHTVAGQLTLRGFSVVRVGNTGPAVAGAPVVAYAAVDRSAALALAEQVPGATLVELPSARAGVVELHISAGFHRLATAAEASAAKARDVAAAAPSPAVCATPRG